MYEDASFNSKILLFGEYSIMKNSKALAAPFTLFRGMLTFGKTGQGAPKTQHSNRELKAFGDYLRFKKNQGDLFFQFDLTSFEFDVSQGLIFDSNIPQGFGVGSSGALTAALFHRYGQECPKDVSTITSERIQELKQIFSFMESHFHGSSSGFDPLICYLNTPLLIQSKNDIQITQIPSFPKPTGAVFLLNTGRPRRTEPLVHLFLEKCKNPEFNALCTDTLSSLTDRAISAFLSADRSSVLTEVRSLSSFQYQHFEPMIPPIFRKLWLEGLRSEAFYLKLCGAGGGGFILGFTERIELMRKLLSQHEIRILYEI